jgi:hypothetical protein
VYGNYIIHLLIILSKLYSIPQKYRKNRVDNSIRLDNSLRLGFGLNGEPIALAINSNTNKIYVAIQERNLEFRIYYNLL